MPDRISLKAARVNANMTIAEVSHHINVTPKTISLWERGKSSIPTDLFKKMCDLYKINWDFVIVPKVEE